MKSIIIKTFILLAIAIYSTTSVPAFIPPDTIHTSAGDQRRRDRDEQPRPPEGRDRGRPDDGGNRNRRSEDNNRNDQGRQRDRDNGGQNDRGKDIRIIPRPDKERR